MKQFLRVILVLSCMGTMSIYTKQKNNNNMIQILLTSKEYKIPRMTFTLATTLLGIHAIALRLSRREASRLREEENLSWKNLFKINKAHTKKYWKDAAYLLIGTFDKLNDITIKTKTSEGWHIKKTHKYQPPTGLFCTIHDVIRTSTKRLNEIFKESDAFWSFMTVIITYKIYKNQTDNQ